MEITTRWWDEGTLAVIRVGKLDRREVTVKGKVENRIWRCNRRFKVGEEELIFRRLPVELSDIVLECGGRYQKKKKKVYPVDPRRRRRVAKVELGRLIWNKEETEEEFDKLLDDLMQCEDWQNAGEEIRELCLSEDG
jgi:hypothetical protein